MNNSNIIDSDRYVFWLDDISILYKNKNYLNFIPTSSMSRIEQLNSITRFCIYLLIIILLFDDSSDNWILLPITVIIFIIILYNIFNIDIDGKYKELKRIRKFNNENFELSDNINGIPSIIDINNNNNIDTNYALESGIYDSNGSLHNSTYYGPLNNNSQLNNINYLLNEEQLYKKQSQRKPTKDNPFMNPSVNDFNSENIIVPSNSDDKDIQQDIELKYNDDIYKDIHDVFNKKNSQRQFFTVAHNIPNDQEGFARWCYKFPPTCKTTNNRCLRYEDIR